MGVLVGGHVGLPRSSFKPGRYIPRREGAGQHEGPRVAGKDCCRGKGPPCALKRLAQRPRRRDASQQKRCSLLSKSWRSASATVTTTCADATLLPRTECCGGRRPFATS